MVSDGDFLDVLGIWAGVDFYKCAFCQIVTIIEMEYMLSNAQAATR